MVYIRKKHVKGCDYLYLVKSKWHKVKKTSRQEIIKYLGESSFVSLSDIPEQYRNDPKILAFLLKNTSGDQKNKNALIKKNQTEFYANLISGNFNASINLAEKFVSSSSIQHFYEKIVIPVMEKIGFDWANNVITIAEEHIASNIVKGIIKIISEKHKQKVPTKPVIIITTPVGEDHSIGCDVLESYLTSKGFSVFNLAPGTPTKSLLQFIKNIHPKYLFISIMLEENLISGKRLTKKISNEYSKLKIFVGGQAFMNNSIQNFDATIIPNTNSLEQIPRLLKSKF